MHSIRTRITILTLCAVIVSVAIVACIGVISIRNLGVRDAEQMLYLLCRTGQMNLDANLEDVEQSVRTVAVMVQDGLDTVSEEDLPNLLEKTRKIYGKEVFHTNDVLTYYFRVDPEVSDTLRGFWYTNLLGDGFTEHEVTDLATYDPNDPEGLVWFTVPKSLGQATWLPPYVTANLDHRVISYNVPVYWNGSFFGVIGMEVASTLMEEEVDHIQLFENGYAYITDEEGNLIYHPHVDTDSANAPKEPESLRSDAENVSNAQESLNSDSANVLKTPTELRGDTANVRYWFNGVEKMAVWLPLRNGMRLYVTVPVEECSRGTRQLIWISVAASMLVLLAVCIISMRYAGHLTKPLRELIAAAEQVEQGNYDFTLQYDKQDEVGILTRAFRRLAEYLKEHIGDLNKRVYIDALTSVRNKGAYAEYLQELQEQIDTSQEPPAFAAGIFDCDNLKEINDVYGHEKGDIYIQSACRLICRVFQHSPVFRIGGDEFAVILQGEDFRNREALLEKFRTEREAICQKEREKWRQVRVTLGIAVYDPSRDHAVTDTFQRADESMYANKRARKEGRQDRFDL